MILWQRRPPQKKKKVDCAADQRAWPAAPDIRFHFGVESLHSFLTFKVGWVHPLYEASWLSVWAKAPSLEKPSASDLHCLDPLVCSVWPVPLEEDKRANYQPLLRDRHDVIVLLGHNRLQMRGAGPLRSLIHLTKSKGALKKKKSNIHEHFYSSKLSVRQTANTTKDEKHTEISQHLI